MKTKQDIVKRIIHDRLTSRYSYTPESLESSVRHALSVERIDEQWERLSNAGLVCLQVFPDEHCSFDDLAGDTYDVALNASTVPGGERTIIAQRKAFERTIERDGVWGLVGFYRTDSIADEQGLSVNNPCHDVDYYASRYHPRGFTQAEKDGWTHADSCWGFVGNDWQDSGYDHDIKRATINALVDALRERKRFIGNCPTCQQPMHRSAKRTG